MATINNADYSLAPTRGLKGEMCKGGMKGGDCTGEATVLTQNQGGTEEREEDMLKPG